MPYTVDNQPSDLRTLMAERELSYRDLGSLSGLDAGYLHRVVNRKRRPSRDALNRVAEALKVPVAGLLEGYEVGNRRRTFVGSEGHECPTCGALPRHWRER